MIFSETPIPTAIDGPAPSDASALRPPSAAVKAEMARMDYELAVAQMDLGAGAEPAQPPEGEYAAPEPAADDAPQAESATEAAETDVEPAPVPDQAGSEPDPRA
jgi:hypothetical protein